MKIHRSTSSPPAAGDAAQALPQHDIDRLMDTAAELFAEFGFDGVSVRAIARAADWSAPLIFYHFTSKANLYEEVFAHKIDQSIEYVEERLRGVTEPRLRLRELVEALCDMYIGNRPLLALMQHDLAYSSMNLGRLRSRRQYEHYTALIRRSLSGALGQAVGSELAFMTGALILGFCELSAAEPDKDLVNDPETLRREKARLVRAVDRLVGDGAPF